MDIAAAYLLSISELLMHLVGMPVSVVSLLLLARTSLIHANLKLILIYHSNCLLIRGVARFAICLCKFIFLDPISGEQLEPFHTIYIFCAYNRNFIMHILILERVMATLMIRSYERKRHLPIFAALSTTVFCVSLFNILAKGGAQKESTLGNVVTNSVMVVLGVSELAVFLWLTSYNGRIYKRMQGVAEHNLSERYQLSENIRTGRLLKPTLALQFVNILIMAAINFYLYFFVNPNNLFVLAATTTVSFIGLTVEVTMITLHPFLKRDFFTLLASTTKWLGIRRGAVVYPEGSTANARRSIALRGIIDGQVLTESQQQEQERHFAMQNKNKRETFSFHRFSQLSTLRQHNAVGWVSAALHTEAA